MGDMSLIIVPKSDQINADDLLGRTMTITVTDVKIRGGQEQPISIHFRESDKVFRPCKSMCRVMAQAWGLDSAQYVGRAMTLYCDPAVKFGPLAVGGIRISHMSHIDGPMTMALTATKGVKKSFKVLPLVVPSDAAAFTIEDARDALQLADTLGALKDVWVKARMRPYREELQAEMDQRKADLSDPTEGPATEQMGESHTDIDADEMAQRARDASNAMLEREQ